LGKVLRARIAQMNSLFWPLSELLCGFQMLAGFIYAGVLAIHGEITIGPILLCRHVDPAHLADAQPGRIIVNTPPAWFRMNA